MPGVINERRAGGRFEWVSNRQFPPNEREDCVDQAQSITRGMLNRPTAKAQLVFCRDRPLWRSVIGEWFVNRGSRNATEGVPYSAFVGRHSPQPRAAPAASVGQRLDLPNHTLVERIERKDGADVVETGHTIILILRHGGGTPFSCRARPPWRAVTANSAAALGTPRRACPTARKILPALPMKR